MVSFDLSGNVAVITGGAGILCSAMAKGLAEAGAQIAVLDLDELGRRRSLPRSRHRLGMRLE